MKQLNQACVFLLEKVKTVGRKLFLLTCKKNDLLFYFIIATLLEKKKRPIGRFLIDLNKLRI